MKTLHLLGSGLLAGAFIAAAALYYQDRDPPLAPAAESIRDNLLERLSKNRPDGEATNSDKCAAHYLAIQQHEEGAKRDAFKADALLSGIAEEEVSANIAVAERHDVPYALYVFLACGNREKPRSFTEHMQSQLKFQ